MSEAKKTGTRVSTGRAKKPPEVKPASKSPKTSKDMLRSLSETQDQLALIHGVLEELCERQEAMIAWQLDFAKNIMALHASANDVEVALSSEVDEALVVVDEANEHFNEMSKDFSKKRESRRKKSVRFMKRLPLGLGDSEGQQQEERPDSVLVVPESQVVH